MGADRARTGVEQLGVDFGHRLLGPALGGRVAAESAPGDLGHPPYDVVVGARLQPFPHQRAPDLAEAGLGEGVLRQRKDQGRPEPPVHDRGGAHGGQRAEEVRVVVLVGRLARVVEGDHQVFRVASGGPSREGGDVRARHTVQLRERGLQFVAEVADPVDDDAVLAASHQGQPARVDPSEVAAAEPAVLGAGLRGRPFVPVVAGADHGAGQLELADVARGHRPVLLVDDADAQPFDGRPEVGELRAGVRLREVQGVDAPRAGLGHPEGGPQRVGRQAVGREALQEGAAGGDDHGLTPTDDVPHPAQVEGLGAGTGGGQQAQQEIGGEGHRHAVARDEPQELQGLAEYHRRLDVQLAAARVHRQQMAFQQGRHMVEGDPVEGGVRRGEPVVAVLARHGRQQVGVREGHRLGAAGGTRRQDQHGRVAGRRLVQLGGRLVPVQRVQGDDTDAVHPGEFCGEPGVGEHQRAVQQAVHMAQLRGPALRIAVDRSERAGNEAAQHARPERGEEFLRILQAQHDSVLCDGAQGSQGGENFAGPGRQLRITLGDIRIRRTALTVVEAGIRLVSRSPGQKAGDIAWRRIGHVLSGPLRSCRTSAGRAGLGENSRARSPRTARDGIEWTGRDI